jgi:hypothetical protein
MLRMEHWLMTLLTFIFMLDVNSSFLYYLFEVCDCLKFLGIVFGARFSL